jgi:hypothetical protein
MWICSLREKIEWEKNFDDFDSLFFTLDLLLSVLIFSDQKSENIMCATDRGHSKFQISADG